MLQTTSLVVELLVIGAGAALWVLLLVMAVLGPGAVPLAAVVTPAGLLVALPFVYLLGILTDRAADELFGKLEGRNLFEKIYGEGADKHPFYVGRRFIMHHSEPLYEMLQYGRSRMRICRGWCFNSGLGLLAWLILWCSWPPYELSWRAGWLGASGLVALIVWSGWSWRLLVKQDYNKVRRQAPYLALPEEDRRARMREIGERWETEDLREGASSDPDPDQPSTQP